MVFHTKKRERYDNFQKLHDDLKSYGAFCQLAAGISEICILLFCPVYRVYPAAGGAG